MSDLRVATNSAQESLIRQLSGNQRTMVDLQKQLASGRRVSKPEDDPLVFGRTIQKEADKALLEQYHTNNILAESTVKISALHVDELRNLGDLAVGIFNATGDSSSDAEIDGAFRQLDEILNQAFDIANSKQDGAYLFAGVSYATDPYSIDGTDPTSVAYNGSPTDRTDPNFAEAETYVGTNTKFAARLNPEHNEDIQEMLQGIMNLRNAFDRSIASYDSSTARGFASDLEAADDKLIVASSDLITKQMRLELAGRADSNLYNQLDSSISAEVSVDLTDVTVKLKQAETSYNAALSSASTLLNISLLNYI